MVTRYDVISSRRSSNFWVKMHVFSTFFNNTNNLWMKWYKVRIYGLLYMSSTENDHLSRFYLTCFLILGKMQDGDFSAWISSNLFVRVTATQTFGLVNLVLSPQTVFFECEHPFIDNPMDIAEPTVASTGLGSKPYPSNLSRMFNKDPTRFEQSLSQVRQNPNFV